MTDVIHGGCKKADHASLIRHARRHYEMVSTVACMWSSIIPACISAYEREPALLAEIERLKKRVVELEEICPDTVNCTNGNVQLALF